jgi:hypothetical protein
MAFVGFPRGTKLPAPNENYGDREVLVQSCGDQLCPIIR